MNTRTWNLKLMATDDHPATTLEGVSHEDATKILRGLMYGPGSTEYGHVQEPLRRPASPSTATRAARGLTHPPRRSRRRSDQQHLEGLPRGALPSFGARACHIYPVGYTLSMDAAASLRDARRRAGLTQAELARRAGTSQATISAYEHGRKEPSVETLGRLLAALARG